MKPPRSLPFSSIEPLEARIAPALVVGNPLPDLVPGVGKTGATVDLSKIIASPSSSAYHTIVQFTTNYDTDPATPGLQAGIIDFELLNDQAPLTVQNFLSYVLSTNPKQNYLGTFFHRAGQNFILQGGGYDATTPTQHIPVGPPVHNEPDPVNRPNVTGTVAMAKLGFDPNSATSEFFINLADNSSLDTQNGGFTVFAKVIQGLDVAQNISKLPYYNQGNDGTGTPVQNYNPDPDHNPSTPPPKPTPDQYVRITGVKVLPPAVTDTTGQSYSVHVYQPGTTTPSTLATATLKGSALTLKYAPGKSGLADVVVDVTKGGETVMDTFHLDVRSNLIIGLNGDPLPGQLVPGDTSTVSFHLTNNGAAPALGTADVQLFLAKVDLVGSTLQLEEPLVRTPIGHLTGVALNLASGQSQTYSAAIQVPEQLGTTDGQFYQLMAEVVPKTGNVTSERFADDDLALNGGKHELRNSFGTFTSSDGFGTRTNAVLKLATTDVLGHPTVATWTVTGSGTGQLSADAQGLHLQTQGTNLASAVTAALSAGSAHLSLAGAQFLAPIGAVNLGLVDDHGYTVASGGLKSLVLGNLTGEGLLLIGAVPPDNLTKAAITLGRVHDFSLESEMPIAALTAVEWLDTAGSSKNSISAPSLGTLRITGAATSRGDLAADVSLSDGVTTTSISVAGLVQNATISTPGSLGTVTVGGLDHSNVFAGTTQRPASLSDFTSNQKIASFTIAGIKGYVGSLFSDAQVAAQTLGTIKVMGVDGASSADDFGFVADIIQSYTRTGGPTASNVTAPKEIDRVGHYVAEVL